MRLLFALLAVLLAACGMTDEKTVNEEIAPASAVTAKLDAEFKGARIPASFSAIKAVKGHTTWGATSLSYSAAYRASQSEIQSFLNDVHAHKDSVFYRHADGCPPSTPDASHTVAPTPMVALWMDKGIFDRCATIESWYVPAAQLVHERATANIYRPQGPSNIDSKTNVVIGVGVPASSQG